MTDVVSICIPVYNGEKYLHECLHTVREQTYKYLDILVIDDGSTDHSVEIIKKFRELDGRIRLLINDQNLGLVKNWQKCIEYANGVWIKFMFQDDTIKPSCVEEMVRESLKHQVSICICSRSFIIENNTSKSVENYFFKDVVKLEESYSDVKQFVPQEIASLAKDKLFDNFIGEPITLLFKKDIIRRIGNYNSELIQLVDYEFALRACLNYNSVFIPKRLVSFRTHSQSATSLKESTGIKGIKVMYVEPLIIFHEYLFNPCFKLLRASYGFLGLLKSAAVFYKFHDNSSQLYKSINKELLRKYKRLRIVQSVSALLTLKMIIKKMQFVCWYLL